MEHDFFNQFQFQSKIVGELPILNHFLEKLKVRTLLEKYIPSNTTQKLNHSDTILILVKNVLIERNPFYQFSEWVIQYDSNLIGIGNTSPSILNDDRIGRSLDSLFQADRASMLTELVLTAKSEFKIRFSDFHNDTTSVTVSGDYNKNGNSEDKATIILCNGHNKEHRPDLKQLVYSLTISNDGAVPIHYKIFDGNKTDDKTHIEVWKSLKELAGSPDFIYVADSKLCTREQLDFIARSEGKFITVLPKTRKEIKIFNELSKINTVGWTELVRITDGKTKHEIIYRGFESPFFYSSEGYRIIWIFSSQKKYLDAKSRQNRIRKTEEALESLKSKLGKYNLKTNEQIQDAVQEIFKKYNSENWFDWKLDKSEMKHRKQKGRGRPGKNTPYDVITKIIWSLKFSLDEKEILESSSIEGVFPIITNIPSDMLSMKEILLKYKYQPFIEKRNEQFKSVFDVMPVFLKLVHRIEAFMFVYFIVLLLNALIERELRQAMKSNDIKSLPIYPEKRKCASPTTERILALFSNFRRHSFFHENKVIKEYYDTLSDLHFKILNLLHVPTTSYHE